MMKKHFFWMATALLAGAMVLTSCSSSDDPANPETPSVDPGQGTPVNPADMQMAPLSGFVYDLNGDPLSEVTITSGTEETMTGADGGFVLQNVATVNNRTLVTFSKSGYFEVVRSLPTAAGSVWEVCMSSTYEPGMSGYAYFLANEEKTLVSGDMKIDFEANGMNTADAEGKATGTEFTDYVNARSLYLSPDKEATFAKMMPGGDLAAKRADGSEAALVSYGMVKVELSSNSQKPLQLADGKPATLKFPIPEKYKDNTPSTIPLWSFNESTGLWEEEGTAKLENGMYVGTVTHFSWVNLDQPEKRATLKLTLKDEAGNALPNISVNVDGQRTITTNVMGKAECYVPTNTDFYVTVNSENYANYTPEVKKTVTGIATPGDIDVELVLPVVVHLSGKVVNTGVGSAISSLWIEYDGKKSKAIHTDDSGKFYMMAPQDYQGEAVLKVRAHDGTTRAYDITLDGQDHAYTLEIKAKKNSGGQATVKLKDNSRTYTIEIPSFNFEGLNGVSIADGVLDVQNSADEKSISLYNIDNYSEGTTEYTGIRFTFRESYRKYAGSYNLNGVIDNKVTITKDADGFYRFQLEGDAEMYDAENGVSTGNNAANATIKADFTAPLLGKAKSLRRLVNKDPSFPSFTPWLEGKTVDYALQITESERLGNGILLLYFNTSLNYSDYKKLKEQAKAALGVDPVYCADFEGNETNGEQDMSSAYFVKGEKYIMVSYCPWRDETIDENFKFNIGGLMDNHHARIHVHVLDGLKIDYNQFIHKFRVKGERSDWEPVWTRKQ